MFAADGVINPVQAAPHLSPETFDAIRMHVAANVLKGATPKSLIPASKFLTDVAMGTTLVSENARRLSDVLADRLFHLALTRGWMFWRGLICSKKASMTYLENRFR